MSSSRKLSSARRPRKKHIWKEELPPEARSRSPTSSPPGSPAARPLSSQLKLAKGDRFELHTYVPSGKTTRIEPFPVGDASIDILTIKTSDDLSWRASSYTSTARQVTTSPRTYKYPFKSKTPQITPSKRTAPGFLEHKATPRAAPSIKNSATKTSTAILGPSEGYDYHSSFRSKYPWPQSIESPVQGGGIHANLDSAMADDNHGKILLYEGSIAKEMVRSPKSQGSSAFHPTAQRRATVEEQRMPYRQKESHPLEMEETIKTLPQTYFAMTKRSGTGRSSLPRSPTADIKEFYEIGKTTPCPDIAIAVDRSPINYSMFNASASHVGDWAAQKYGQIPRAHTSAGYYDYESSEYSSYSYWEPVSTFGSSARFPPEGHPHSMFKAPVCSNEVYDVKKGTIDESLSKHPMRYSLMSSKTGRSTAQEMAVGKPAMKISEASLPKDNIYDNVDGGLNQHQKSVAAVVATTARSYHSVLNTSVERFPAVYTWDPTDTVEHHMRRQHLLESRIASLREKTPEMSPKLKKILNL